VRTRKWLLVLRKAGFIPSKFKMVWAARFYWTHTKIKMKML